MRLPTDDECRRLRELVSRYEAGAVEWEAFVAGVLGIMTRDNCGGLKDEMPEALFWKVACHVADPDPNHWFRGFGEGESVDMLRTAGEDI